MPPKKPTKGAFKVKALLIDMRPTTYNTRFRANALHQVKDTINQQGLPVLLAHDSSKMPVGSWYEAEVTNDAVYTKFFIPKEVSEYEDIKTRIDANILDSVSIGFNADTHDCSICGNDIQDYNNCTHIPGHEYDIKDPINGHSLGAETCYVMLDDVKASEASLVYSGAVPAAKIVESSDKADFFTKNNLNFAKGELEIVHSGEFMQDHNVNNNNPKGEDDMDKEQFDKLTTDHAALNTKFSDTNDKLGEITEKYNTVREDNIDLKEKNLEFKTKVDGYDDAVVAKDDAEQSEKDTIFSISEKVEALAAPFEPAYKAPETITGLLADLDKYLEQAKALPSGQQTSDTEVVYTEPDSTYQTK